MASIKDLRKRITSTKSTQQTTRAMKMVSAAKLRRAQDAILAHRPYARRIGDLIRTVLSMPEVQVDSPLLRRSRILGADEKKNVLLVLVSSDRGLCGSFNSNVIKAALQYTADKKSEPVAIKYAFVGRKAHDFFRSRKLGEGEYYPELGGKVTFDKARKIAEIAIGKFMSGEVDEVKFVYNEFKNAISQRVLVEDFLPLLDGIAGEGGKSAEASGILVKPSPEAVLTELLNRHFAIQTFRILLESQAGEHGARMSAMENATKNAEEMIRKITLQYNKQRQAGITKELLEIIGGTEAQASSG